MAPGKGADLRRGKAFERGWSGILINVASVANGKRIVRPNEHSIIPPSY